MTATSHACQDVGAYMNRSVAYVGPFEAVYDALFGPFQHDAHVKCRAAHVAAGTLADRIRRADEAVRAECVRMSAETAEKLARHSRATLMAAE